MQRITEAQAAWFEQMFQQVVANIERAVVGKREVVEIAVTCLLAQGHLLIEDVPGNGKTTLAKALAKTIMGSQSRIQFTPDLSPSDITGTAVFDDRTGRYRFHSGPVFNTIVLADEINRASPRTQAALLEVMEEGRVTVRGVTNTIGPPFMVIATQNPRESQGTFPLPDAQLDRFLMRTSLGYPDEDSTLSLMGDAAVRDRSVRVEAMLNTQTLASILELSDAVATDTDLLRFVYRIADLTRSLPEIQTGLSLRGCLAFLRAVKTWAAAHGRTEVTRDDVLALAQPVIGHRLALTPDAEARGVDSTAAVQHVLDLAVESEIRL